MWNGLIIQQYNSITLKNYFNENWIFNRFYKIKTLFLIS